jgi:tetratricopeptide (TPR) repeat protein
MRDSLAPLCLAMALTMASLVAPNIASAEEGDEAARVHFQSGTRYFDRGEYEAAIREFTAAFELSGRPQLLYNLYLAHERLGQIREAAETLAAYLDQVEEVEGRARLEARLETLRRRVAKLDAEEAAARAGEGEPATEPRRGGMPLPALVSFGAAGAGFVTFAVAGGLALAEDSSLADRCGANAGRTCTPSDLDKLGRRTTAADVGIAVTAVGAAAGLVLYFVLRDRGEPEATSRVRVTHDGFALTF